MDEPKWSQQAAQAPEARGAAEPSLASRMEAMPHLPGVYLFKDGDGKILYAGKAKDLRKRISSYLRHSAVGDLKTRVFLAKAVDIEYLVTASEKEALLLEASLIKKHRPRYNVILRDDKNYLALRIDPREPFPRLEVVRRFQKDKALYFGPYPSAHTVRETLKLLETLFPLRHCRGKRLIPRERPCLNHALGRCLGVCAGKVTQEEYQKAVHEVVLFLQGKTDTLQRQLQQRMREAAEVLDFELAARCRDRLQGIATVLEKQRIVSDRFHNQDVLGVYQEEGRTALVVLFIRQGVLIGKQDFDLRQAQGETEELLRSFIQQYYREGRFIPDEIVVPVALEDADTLEEWLTEKKAKRVRIVPASRGERRQLLDLAASNAQEHFNRCRKQQHRNVALLGGLQRLLKLPALPLRMACVDISNLQGLHAVGAVVVFENGQPAMESYRAYRLEGKTEPDDPAMMAEVLERFWDEDRGIASSLDLLVLDGGKGHLNRIARLFKEKALAAPIPIIALAKEREGDQGAKGRGLYEKVYVPGRKNPLFLAHAPDLLHLLQRLRDEAHRFAITHYKSIHGRDQLASALDAIPGIGPKRKQALLLHFESMEALQQASPEALRKIPGISPKLAGMIVAGMGDG